MLREWPFVMPPEWRGAGAAIDATGFTPVESGKPPAGVLIAEGEWAGMKRMTGGSEAGPTGMPWVDSNGWKIRLLSMQNPGQQVWVHTKPPAANEVIRFERYLVGVADAASHGGRWVIEPDANFRRTLAAADPTAKKNWDRLKAAVRFFTERTQLCGLPARAVTGIVSDFSGANEVFSQEILNLAARQHLPYLPLLKTNLTSLPAGLKAVVYADEQAPTAPLRSLLLRFVEAGGLLMTTAAWGKVAGPVLPDTPTVRYAIHTVGKGRIAVPEGEESGDPYLAAADAQVLLSHRHDIARLWNGGPMGMFPTGDARRSVVHLVNYMGRPTADPVSLWIQGDFRTVTLHSFEYSEAKKLTIIRRRNGAEVHLPAIAIYAAVEAVA
ncbi:MAG: hypothetical protein JNK48_15630 [Bryobacterales bacterium]|nr:hypothetical protein [Bryobacterales bacterium]